MKTAKTGQQNPPLRLHIDWTRCDGRGLCAELLPELLDRDDWGYPLSRTGSAEPDIGPEHLKLSLIHI